MDSTAPSLVAAVQWMEALVLGGFATTVAVIAIAGFGYAALTGRLSIKRSMTILVGCFVLFGAPAIAHAMLMLFGGGADGEIIPAPEPQQASEPPFTVPPFPDARQPAANPFDPYASIARRPPAPVDQ